MCWSGRDASHVLTKNLTMCWSRKDASHVLTEDLTMCWSRRDASHVLNEDLDHVLAEDLDHGHIDQGDDIRCWHDLLGGLGGHFPFPCPCGDLA